MSISLLKSLQTAVSTRSPVKVNYRPTPIVNNSVIIIMQFMHA